MDFLDEESDSESEAYELFGGKEGVVFLVDATEPMFDCQQFSLAIQCVKNMMKSRAIASPSDEMSLILFGTNLTSNADSFQHIFIVQKLQKTSADLILGLNNLTDCDFSSKFGHNTQYSLADVFTTALSEFTKSKSHFASKTVYLLTSCSEPHSGNTPEARHLRKTAIIRAKDFKDHNIDVELIPMGTGFDLEAFYQDVFPDLKTDSIDFSTKLAELLDRKYCKSFRQRMLASIPFCLGPWGQQSGVVPEVKMSVYVYSLYLEAKKPIAVKLNRKDLKEVVNETHIWTKDCGEMVYSESLTKKYNFGNKAIFMNKTDLKFVQNFEEPALTLLGFKDRKAIPVHLHIKPGQFIYPNESAIKGTTVLFNALLKRCTEREKIPICRLTLRRSSNPHLVALLPQIEIKLLGKAGGFHVLYLPFKEDIREREMKGCEGLPLSEKALGLAKNIVEKLSFKYDPKNFPNPVLQTHWRAIEALALNYDNIDPFDDSQTQPDYEDIERKAGIDLKELNELLGGSSVPSMQKKVKVSEDLSDLAENNKLGSLTVPELRQFCTQKDIKCLGTKKLDFIQAIRLFYGL